MEIEIGGAQSGADHPNENRRESSYSLYVKTPNDEPTGVVVGPDETRTQLGTWHLCTARKKSREKTSAGNAIQVTFSPSLCISYLPFSNPFRRLTLGKKCLWFLRNPVSPPIPLPPPSRSLFLAQPDCGCFSLSLLPFPPQRNVVGIGDLCGPRAILDACVVAHAPDGDAGGRTVEGGGGAGLACTLELSPVKQEKEEEEEEGKKYPRKRVHSKRERK